MGKRLRLKSVKQGRTKNWLIFTCYVPMYDINKEYKVEFCGTELHVNFGITNSENEQLLELFVSDFGYAPYDIVKAQKILEKLDIYSWDSDLSD